MAVLLNPTADNLALCANHMAQGGLVAFPTETVYGLGGRADDPAAVASIFAVKGRPHFNPLIAHVASADAARAIGVFDDRADFLASLVWPGPMTLVLPAWANAPVCDLARAGLETVAVRVPSHKTALEFLARCPFPVVAPSANRSGRISPTAPGHVAADLGNDIEYILAGGASAVGLESTVIDLTGDAPVILRQGAITAGMVADALGLDGVAVSDGNPDKPSSPGQLERHYAPQKPLRLRAVDVSPDEALLAFGPTRFMGIKGGGGVGDLPEGRLLNLSESGDLVEAASRLYGCLRELDAGDARGIAVMDIPDRELGAAINDRLRRASVST